MLCYSIFVLLLSLAHQAQADNPKVAALSSAVDGVVLKTVEAQVKSGIRPDVGKLMKVVYTVKCPGQFEGQYYTITKSSYSVHKCRCRVSHDCPSNCLNGKTAMNVFCLNSLELRKDKDPRFLGAACYEDKKNSSKEYDPAPADVCVTSRYPGTEMPRLELPESARSPKNELLYYDPPQLEERAHAQFEDAASNPARLPVNQVERTGFQGLGILKPGANYVLYLVVLRGTKPNEELLLEKEGNQFSLPQYSPSNTTVKKAFIKEKVEEVTKMVGCGSSSEKAFQGRKKLYKGYIAGKHNTDNAWTEGKIVQVRITETTCARGPLPEKAYVWKKVSSTNTGTVDEMIKPLMMK